MRLADVFVVVLFAIIGLVVGDISCPNHGLDSFFSRNINITSLCAERESDITITGVPPPPKPARPIPAPPPARPDQRPASDELWNKCSNKGCSLSWAMHAEDSVAGAAFNPSRNMAKSPYQSITDLIDWGWDTFANTKIDESYQDLYATWGIGWALEALGISPYVTDYEGGNNALFIIDHESYDDESISVDDKWYFMDNKWYRATGASYSFTLNWIEGVIIALNRQSPRYAAEEREPKVPLDMMPGLKQFSDIAWIGWESVTEKHNAPINNLRYFLSVGIVNLDTKQVILRAMKQKSWGLGHFPGRTFEPTDSEFSALLGTPNIQGFAYFLIEHKEQLGNMFISKLQVFLGDTSHRSPCILMHVSPPSSTSTAVRRDSGVDGVRSHVLQW
ncbi:hypothetical protein J1614_003357 [Plenodomus biglobosus]|nr:hypothetical protein J1614_003357 [Plenodomus biglobosus]